MGSKRTANLSATNVYATRIPPEGPKVTPVKFDWTVANVSPVELTLSNLQNVTKISGVQCLFIDNSTNDAPVTVTIEETNQSITLAAGYQGYFPVMVTDRNVFIVSSTSTLQSTIIGFMNYQERYGIWPAFAAPASAATPIAVADAILDAIVVGGRFNVRSINAQATDVDHSGSIAVAATAQALMPANINRRGWRVQNNDVNFPAEEIWICTTGAAIINGQGSMSLAAYSAAGFPGGAVDGVGSNAISIIATSAGHKFYAIEW